MFDEFLILERILHSRALVCCPDLGRIWLQSRQPVHHPARILPLLDIDSPQNNSGLRKNDCLHLLINFVSEGILQVICGQCFSYIGGTELL